MLGQARRQNLLHALGIDVYVRRDKPSNSSANDVFLSIICDETVIAAGRQRLRTDLLLALGLSESQVAWRGVGANGLATPPPTGTPIWLVLGENLMSPVTAHLSKHDVQPDITVAPNLFGLRSDAAAKRELWKKLKTLIRILRG